MRGTVFWGPYNKDPAIQGTILLGGSWDLVSNVISTLIGVISSYKYSYLTYKPSY